jgi:hypothetical protein
MRCLLVSPQLFYLKMLSSVIRRTAGISELRVAVNPTDKWRSFF